MAQVEDRKETTSKHVFVIGITGYVGGSVFTTLKAAHPTYTFTALVRDQSQFPIVTAVGATPVLGSYADRDVIVQQAAEADVVLNCGAMDVPLNEALLEGIRVRKGRGLGVGIYILTSGTTSFSDGSKEGKWVEGSKFWDDSNVDDIKSLTVNTFRGGIDVPLLQASDRGEVHAYIICPSAIYGLGTGPVGRVSHFTRIVCDAYVEKGAAFVVGEGSNIEGYTHIADLADLFLLVLSHAISNYPPTTSAYERYIFAVSTHIPWSTTAALFAELLYKRGKIPSGEVKQVGYDELGAFGFLFGSNFATKSERAKALGWVPKRPSFEETAKEEVDAFYPAV